MCLCYENILMIVKISVKCGAGREKKFKLLEKIFLLLLKATQLATIGNFLILKFGSFFLIERRDDDDGKDNFLQFPSRDRAQKTRKKNLNIKKGDEAHRMLKKEAT